LSPSPAASPALTAAAPPLAAALPAPAGPPGTLPPGPGPEPGAAADLPPGAVRPFGPVLARRITKVLLGCLVGYGVLWVCSVGGMLALSAWARHDGTGTSSGSRTSAGINHFLRVDQHLWRGSAPSAAGYRELAGQGIATVVDLRAEDLSAAELAQPQKAGLRAVRLPIRDGQTPTEQQVDEFLRIVRGSDGPVFVHCGAGVGRTGSITAAYLVRTGEATSRQAALRTVAVGPPSIEQVYYVLNVSRDDSDQPPALVRAISRLFDAPRRIKASL
jgi:protein-tyrosine phosphatase